MTGASATWILRRSRVPDRLAATMVAASGAAGMAGEGWLWWAGIAALVAGSAALLVGARRPDEILRLTLGDRVRLERLPPGYPGTPGHAVTATDSRPGIEGLLDGGSVVTSWLIALRIRSADGRRADLVLTAGCATPEDLRRLRVRLLTDESLRA